MKAKFQHDFARSRSDGFEVALGQPVNDGPVLRVSGHAETAAALSNPILLAQFGQVEIGGLNGAPSLYLATHSAIEHPQMHLGYDVDGIALLLGLDRASEGHISIAGQSRSGKTTEASSLAFQACRNGVPVCVIGCKDLDYMFLGPLKAACDALTRLDKNGNPILAPFRFVTLRSNTPTYGFNFFDQSKYDQPSWMLTADLLKALGQDGGESDPVRRYYIGSAQALFQSISWGQSARDFLQNIKTHKMDEETRRSTAGAVHEVSQLAAIEHLNFSKSHPANIDLASIIRQNGCIYFDPNYMETGAIATAMAGLAASAFISAKRRAKPRRQDKAMLVIDEAQTFPISYLRQLVEQCASSGIILVIIFHNLSQLGEQWESIAMTQVKLFFSAVPASMTEEHLTALFGTHKEYVLSFSDNTGKSHSLGITHSSGPVGSSVSVSDTTGTNEGTGVSLQEKDSPVWTPNDTLALNYDKDQFAAIVTPGAELAYWGPRAILATRGGSHMDFEDVNRYAQEALDEAQRLLIGENEPLKLLPPAPLTPDLENKRERWSSILRAAVMKIRKEFSPA